jgi:hypothetical protein
MPAPAIQLILSVPRKTAGALKRKTLEDGMEHKEIGRVVGIITPRRGSAVFKRPPGLVLMPVMPAPLRLVARPDKDMARLVEQGLNRLFHEGCAAAVNFLSFNGIPLRVISRVLWHPARRRGSAPD